MIYPVFLGCLSATKQLASPGLFLDLILGMIEPVKPTLTIKDDISNGGVHPMLQLHVALPSGHGRSFVLQSSKVGELKNLAKSTFGCSFLRSRLAISWLMNLCKMLDSTVTSSRPLSGEGVV